MDPIEAEMAVHTDEFIDPETGELVIVVDGVEVSRGVVQDACEGDEDV